MLPSQPDPSYALHNTVRSIFRQMVYEWLHLHRAGTPFDLSVRTPRRSRIEPVKKWRMNQQMTTFCIPCSSLIRKQGCTMRRCAVADRVEIPFRSSKNLNQGKFRRHGIHSKRFSCTATGVCLARNGQDVNFISHIHIVRVQGVRKSDFLQANDQINPRLNLGWLAW